MVASEEVLRSVIQQSLLPSEVILACSAALNDLDFVNRWTMSFHEIGVALNILVSPNVLLPGEARNVGISAVNTEWVAFLDIETLPDCNWLQVQMDAVKESNADGCFGSTVYYARTFSERLIRDAIYGRQPVKTLPGSVFKKKVFGIVGQFAPFVRAAEDTEWMIRVKLMGIRILDTPGKGLISYKGLTKLGLIGTLKKWRRNYR